MRLTSKSAPGLIRLCYASLSKWISLLYIQYSVFTKIHFVKHFVSGFPRNNNRKTGVYREIIPRRKFGETDCTGKHISLWQRLFMQIFSIIYLWFKIEMKTTLEVLSKTKQDLRLTKRQLVNNEKFNVWVPWGRLLLDW